MNDITVAKLSGWDRNNLQCEADSVMEVAECEEKASFRAEFHGGSADLCKRHLGEFKENSRVVD